MDDETRRRIEARIEALEAGKEQHIRVASEKLAAFEGAIAELRRLLLEEPTEDAGVTQKDRGD